GGRDTLAPGGANAIVAGRPSPIGWWGQSEATKQIRLDAAAPCRPDHGTRRQRRRRGAAAAGGDHQDLAGTRREADRSGCARQASLSGCNERLDSGAIERLVAAASSRHYGGKA